MAVEMGIVNGARPTSVSPMATLTSSPADSLVTSSVLVATGAFEFFMLHSLGFGTHGGVLESGVAAGAMEGVTRVIFEINSVEADSAGAATGIGCG